MALALIDYLDNDLGDYDEIALSFVVENPPGHAAPAAAVAVATYIHRLPVSQPFTCEAGRGIWGFPSGSPTCASTSATVRPPRSCATTTGPSCCRSGCGVAASSRDRVQPPSR